MEISATVRNAAGTHEALVRTGTTTQPLAITAVTLEPDLERRRPGGSRST